MTLTEKIRKYCPELVSAGFNLTELEEMMDGRFLGDFTIFAAAAGIFLESYEAQLNDIRSAIISEDRKKIYAAAHKFKGAIANFHDSSVADTVERIEMGSSDWDRQKFEAQYGVLVKQTKDFVKQLNQLVDSFGRIQELA
ncbi:Hpt domain-containing protein [Bdellovibrio sp. NC01]|uniref:Hpt domain-containing protein n=1 Tax=Bdellovibrio sp. NC01 TaxID=2220073 RepID=UPI0011576BF2|nr:Hpt domain-containing protein [Bdellovibrio sp. NC01]QDK37374.1 hypothetical protein DOE51_07135 [Bdellovibrio sp. NC01]